MRPWERLLKASKLAAQDVRGYLNRDWDGNDEAWTATAEGLERAIKDVGDNRPVPASPDMTVHFHCEECPDSYSDWPVSSLALGGPPICDECNADMVPDWDWRG